MRLVDDSSPGSHTNGGSERMSVNDTRRTAATTIESSVKRKSMKKKVLEGKTIKALNLIMYSILGMARSFL